MPTAPHTDQVLLQKLLLGQLPTAEVERLATEYAADERLATLAESLTNSSDDLLGLLRHHQTAVIDSEGERLVERLLERLKPVLPPETASLNQTNVNTEPSSPNVTGMPEKLPANLEYYRPIRILGQGGMGTVYLAEDTRLGREVAIKTLRPELAIHPQAKERFLREARTAARLDHDHIIPIYSVGEADGTPFLAMPLLKGEPLDALIRRTAGPLPVSVVVRIAREAASGLAAAHERGLIHRDIKPGNIWLEAPTGRVKILDFGLAKAADAGSEADSETNLTASGAIVGTPAYMAPEQASGHAVDGRADLFSLGCVLYELLSGKRAFSGPNTMSILMSLANHTPAAPDTLSTDCPAGLSRLVMQLLEKNPVYRPASAAAVIQALDALQAAPANREADTIELPASATNRISSAGGLSSATPVHGSMPPAVPITDTGVSGGGDVPRQPQATRNRIPRRFKVALALSGALAMLLSGVVYYVKSNQGTLVVTIEDDTVQAILEKEGLVIRDKNSNSTWKITTGAKKTVEKSLNGGGYQVEVAKGLQLIVVDDNGGEVMTDEFTLKRKGERRILVRLMPPSAVAENGNKIEPNMSADADRRAAEYVLSIGGNIKIKENGQEREIFAVGDLPQGTIELTYLNGTAKTTDAGLANCKGCKNLTELYLAGNSLVTDAGLIHFQGCSALVGLGLSGTQVSDVGLAYFKNCKQLQILGLHSTQVTNVGLIHFQDCQKIVHLELKNTEVGDAGLAHFKKSTELQILTLENTRVSDAGLVHLQDCKNLRIVTLEKTNVSDAGLVRFHDCKLLTAIGLTGTKVTEAGVKKLAAALPESKIEWDGGVIEPTVSPDRRAAAWILANGGSAAYRLKGDPLVHMLAPGNLPQGNLELVAVTMPFVAKVDDAALAEFKGCRHLTFLNLRGNAITDVGVEHFKDCPQLTGLYLGDTLVTNAGLAHFRNRANLVHLDISTPKVTAMGLAVFKDCKDLETLEVRGANVDDDGLALLRGFSNLTYLDLRQTQAGDATLERLARLTKLNRLSVINTMVTEAGVKRLSAALKGCKIEWDGGTIEPMFSERQAAEWVLSIGGTVTIVENDRDRIIGVVADMPPGEFELKAFNLANNPKVSDTKIAYLRGLTNLRQLFLQNTLITDTGLGHLKDLTNLTHLALHGTRVSNAGLPDLKGHSNLVFLDLSHCHFGPSVTDAGLIHLKGLTKLNSLDLSELEISDEGLEHLKGFTALTALSVRGVLHDGVKATITPAGIKTLQAALPGCTIVSDLPSPDRQAAEWTAKPPNGSSSTMAGSTSNAKARRLTISTRSTSCRSSHLRFAPSGTCRQLTWTKLSNT